MMKWGPPPASVVAITGLTILEAIALLKGINGVMFATVTACIGGLGGFSIGNKRGRNHVETRRP